MVNVDTYIYVSATMQTLLYQDAELVVNSYSCAARMHHGRQPALLPQGDIGSRSEDEAD